MKSVRTIKINVDLDMYFVEVKYCHGGGDGYFECWLCKDKTSKTIEQIKEHLYRHPEEDFRRNIGEKLK